jgi:hypothetical protein
MSVRERKARHCSDAARDLDRPLGDQGLSRLIRRLDACRDPSGHDLDRRLAAWA